MADVQVATKSSPKQKPAAKSKKPDKSVQAKPDLVQTKASPQISPSLFNAPEASADRSAALWRPSVQTKLKVGKPGDKYEQEADAVADQVIQARFQQSTPETGAKDLQTQMEEDPEVQTMAEEEPEVQTKSEEEPKVQAKTEVEPEVQAMAEEEPEVQAQAEEEPEVQTKPEEEPEVQAMVEEESEVQAKPEEEPEVQAMEEEEPEVQASEEEDAEIQTKEQDLEVQASVEEEPEVQASEEEDTEIQAKEQDLEVQAKDGDGHTSDSFDSQLSASSNGGSPLSQSTINQVEPHLGADLSGVRVHTDSNAVQMNQQLGSQAFTHKNHVYFNEGKYNPGSTSGDHLIAHELTHTVQQGAAVKTKTEEEPEEEIQAKAESPEIQKQAADAPADGADSPPATPAANADTGGSDPSPPADNTPPPADAGGSNSGNTGNNNADAPANATEPAQQGDLNKDNPITPRTEVKAEEGQTVEKLGLEGSSDEAMASFTQASASEIAATLPGLGESLNQKLGSEKQTAAAGAPVLTAGTTGVKDQKAKPTEAPGAAKNAALKDGATEPEPAKQKLEPHKEGAPRPRYRPDRDADKGKPEKAESGGFFSWLFDMFKNMMGGVKTHDAGMNTKAGATPKLDATGKANPDRTANQSKEGNDQVNQEKDKSAEEIRKNPGQENIQPQYFEDPKTVQLNTELTAQVVSEQDKAMAEFVDMPMPEEVRAQADLDLAPTLEKNLMQPREQTKQAALKRDTEKQAAIDDSQAQVEQLNKDAEAQQQKVVADNRKAVADEQQKGIDEANTQMNAFTTEADKEKIKSDKAVKDRIKKDKEGADKQMKQAEADAAKEKKKGEAQARAEKEKAKKDSEDKSWWGKFKDAVSSAVSWLTEKIGQIFDAIRAAVKFIIDKAKEAALALIEAGRKWIVEKLDQFGNWLKEKVNKYLAAFPALRDRINGFIDKTVNAAKEAVNKIADGLKAGVEALANALTNAINSVLNAFETALTSAVQFAGAMLKGDFAEALKIAFYATCKVAGIDPNPILDFINKAGETINIIFKDPAAFFGNVVSGVKLGLDQFVTNIKKHLISGLIGWLTGAMSDVPIQLPERFDLKGVFSLVMQILGLTYDRIRAKVVKKIGPNGEQVVSGMEAGFQFMKDLVTKGPIVLWEKVKEKFGEIKEMAMEKIRNLVTVEVVKAGIKWMLSLLNPASAIVKAVIMLFDFVMFLIERKDQIIGFVTAVFDTVGPLARGQIKNAANAVEGAMGRGVPVILGLLANLAGLGGIGKAVTKVIKTIQKPVDKVVDPIIGWLVKQGKKLWKKGKKGVKKVKDTIKNLGKKLKTTFKQGKESHSLFFKTEGKKKTLMRASIQEPLKSYTDKLKGRIDALPNTPQNKELKRIMGNIIAARTELEELKNRDTKSSKKPGETQRVLKYANWDDDLGDKINKAMHEMARLLAKIPASLAEPGEDGLQEEGMLARPKSPPINYRKQHPTNPFTETSTGGLTAKSNDGEIAIAETLSMDLGPNKGSSAAPTSPLYIALKKLRGIEVVPGHLINHHLGGSGSNQKNLAPITKSANNKMAQNQEKDLVKKVLTENKVVKYTVHVTWTRGNTPADGKTLLDRKMPTDIISTLQEKEFDENAHKQLLQNDIKAYIKEKQKPEKWKPKGSAENYTVENNAFTSEPGNTLTTAQLADLRLFSDENSRTKTQADKDAGKGRSVFASSLDHLAKLGLLSSVKGPGASPKYSYKITNPGVNVDTLEIDEASKEIVTFLKANASSSFSASQIAKNVTPSTSTVKRKLAKLAGNLVTQIDETPEVNHYRITETGLDALK